MARNSSGTMSAPATYPPQPDTTIDLEHYKELINDIINELTDSLSRSGKGGLTAALKLVDGTQALPGLAFNGEANTGLSRYAAGDVRLSILGALVAKFLASGVEVTGTVKSTGGLADDPSHGNRGGGALHSAATTGSAGFLSAADKTALDGAVAAIAAATPVGSSNTITTTTSGQSPTAILDVGAATATATLTTAAGRQVLVQLQPRTGSYSSYIGVTGSTSSQYLLVEVLRDGVTIGTMRLNVGNATVPPGVISVLDAPAAGAHSYTMRWSLSAAGMGGTINECKLVAVEL